MAKVRGNVHAAGARTITRGLDNVGARHERGEIDGAPGVSGAHIDGAPAIGRGRIDGAMLALCALVPACLAASHLANVPDAAHDGAVARVLGLQEQPWRALDVLVGAPLAMLPIGTRAMRAAMGDVLVTAVAGATLYSLIAGLLAICAETRRLGFLVAAVAAVLPLVGAPWQIEASAVGGSVAGALLVIVPLAFAVRDASSARPGTLGAAAAFTLGLAVGYEPLVGCCAAAGTVTYVAMGSGLRSATSRASAVVPAFVLGLTPLAIAIGHTRGSGASMAEALGMAWSGERGASHAGSPLPFVREEIGPVLTLLAAAGGALAMFVGRARPLALALAAVAVAGLGAGWLGAPVGPTRFGAPVLAGFAALAALAAVAMQGAVRAVAQARVPMARTSAAMILVLEAVMPVEFADDALARAPARGSGATAYWSDATWGSLPLRSAVIVPDRRLYERALADEACDAVRPDLVIVPAYPRAAGARRSLAADASLIPLRRDLELTEIPTEESLSSLAVHRPVAVAFDGRWGRALARHLVPLSLLDRFEPEPRGASDRRHALDGLGPWRDRVVRAIAGDPELVGATVSLLKARENAVGFDSDKELLLRVHADVAAIDREHGR